MPWPKTITGELGPDPGTYTVVGSDRPRVSSWRERTVGAISSP
jgi:hypothetical protein